MKTKQQTTIIITLVFCIAFTMLFPSMAAASIWITVPFDNTTTTLSPANIEEQKTLEALNGTNISVGDLIKKAFPSFIPNLTPEQFKRLDTTPVNWSLYHCFTGEEDISSDILLNQLGIIKDYSMSTNPNNYISRAEFAKIAVAIAGKQGMVEKFKINNSKFQDVKTEEWFNGYINVAVAEGLMNGDPNGCFYPKSEIKQGEALTVLFRILGYNDNLPRKWPANYVNKAASLNAIDDNFSAWKPATYDELFTICNKALDQYIVQYNDNLNTFEYALKEETNIIENGDPQKKIPFSLRQKIFLESKS